MRTIGFRVDASPSLGLGHLSRCLALAARLRSRGARCHFVAGEEARPWAHAVTDAGHALTLLPPHGPDPQADADATRQALSSDTRNFDWLVVDHYALDATWHRRMRSVARRLLAIDDLANRRLEVDAVTDPSPCSDESAYRALTSPRCTLLLGPRHALLREEFSTARAEQGVIGRGSLRIHLAMGGTDPQGATLPIARQLLSLGETVRVRAVLGNEGPQADAMRTLEAEYAGRLELLVATRSMARTMLGCDVAVGAPGGTLWERYCLGLPVACVITAPTQKPVIERLAQAGWLLDLGEAHLFGSGRLPILRTWLADRESLAVQRTSLMRQVDGLGADRLAAWLLETP